MTQKSSYKNYTRYLQKTILQKLGTKHPYMQCLTLVKQHLSAAQKSSQPGGPSVRDEIVRLVFEDLRKDD